MNLVIEIIAYFCECMTQLLCIHAFAGKKIKFDVKTVAVVIINMSVLELINIFNISELSTLGVEIILFIYILCEFKTKISYCIILMILNLIASVSMQALATIPTYIVLEIIGQVKSPYLTGLIINIIALNFMILFTQFVRLHKYYIEFIKWDTTIIRCLGLFCIIVLYLMVKFKLDNKLVVRAYFASAVMACVAIVIVFRWQADRYKVKQKSLELRMHEIYGKTFEGM